MSSDYSVNVQSLRLVQEELVSTIEASARELEGFVTSGQEDAGALQASIEGVQQVLGIFKMLELRGAIALSDELLEAANEITSGAAGKGFERKMEAISNTFFIISRYIEFLLQSKSDVPSLLIPHINALRKLRDEPVFLESHFIRVPLPSNFSAPPMGVERESQDNFRQNVRRIRHMYQIGLSGILREKQLTKSLAFMRRSVRRMRQIGGDQSPLSLLWWLSDLVFNAFVTREMSLWETRKYLFMRLDKLYRQVEIGGEKALNSNPPQGLIKELIYLYAISSNSDKVESSAELDSVVASMELPYSEIELQKEHAILYGPSSQTIDSLSHVLTTEINSAKKTLENASQDGLGKIDDLPSFLSLLESISGILSVVGFKSASDSLKEQISKVATWEKPENLNQNSIAEVAVNLLYLESLVQDINSFELSGTRATHNTDSDRNAQVASHEFTTAIHVVIEESLGALSLTKRALNAYAESNYDVGHIKNISKTLVGVRGAMVLLNQYRVADVLQLCSEFVEEVLLEGDVPATIDEILETFADAIMAVEYYLDSAQSFENMDESVLIVAEESLAALGFEIEAS